MNSEVQKLVLAGKLPAADGDKLSKLEPGVFVLHKSWGVGKIAEWDFMGDRIVIDFEGKPGHPLKLSFAVSSLDLMEGRAVAQIPMRGAFAFDQNHGHGQ